MTLHSVTSRHITSDLVEARGGGAMTCGSRYITFSLTLHCIMPRHISDLVEAREELGELGETLRLRLR